MIRYGEEKDFKTAKYIWEENFSDSEEEINFYFENLYKKEKFLILEENKQIKASLHENPYTINFNAKLLPSFYIVAVAVSPEFRGRGYMKKLLSYSLINARNTGKDILFLSPINTEIYSKFGFGYISGLENYSLKIDDIPFNSINKSIEIRKVDENSFDDLVTFYKDYMKKYNLYLFRDEKYFSRIKKELENENGQIYSFYKDNKIIGYLMCYFKENEIFIREIFYDSIECVKNMLAFIKTFKEYYSMLKVVTPQGSNFNFVFPNQLKIEKKEEPYILGRIVNVENMISLLKIRKNLRIKIKDSIIDENNGIFLIDVTGQIKKMENDLENYNLSVCIEDLTSLLTGYLDIEELLVLEKISIKNIDIEELKIVFNKKKNYIQEYQ